MNLRYKKLLLPVLLAMLGAAAPVSSAAPFEPGAAFVDPTATVPRNGTVTLGKETYIAPFARLATGSGHRIRIGHRANVQDNAVLDATRNDILLGEQAIVAHGAIVKATRRVKVAAETARPGYANPGTAAIERYMAAHPSQYEWGKLPAFIGFNALVDGAVVSDGSMVMHKAMVGPGIVLKTGVKVLPGKRVGTQEEADDPARGKVVYITEDDVEFMHDAVCVNAALAGGYAELARERESGVKGLGYDPGVIAGNETRNLPTVGGQQLLKPDTGPFRYRIIGDVGIDDVGGIRGRVSLRADEGPAMRIGSAVSFQGANTLHALQKTNIAAGNRVVLEPNAIVHGGPGAHLKNGSWTEIGDDSVIGSGAVVFKSRLGAGVRIGPHSLVIDSVIPDGTVIPAGEVWSEGKKLYDVEW